MAKAQTSSNEKYKKNRILNHKSDVINRSEVFNAFEMVHLCDIDLDAESVTVIEIKTVQFRGIIYQQASAASH